MMPATQGAPNLPLTLVAILTLLTPTLAQQIETFVDPLTGINVQRFFGARTQFAFEIALPENPSTAVSIGRISAPMPSGNGWAGIKLHEDMEGSLFLTAYHQNSGIVPSFRIADNEYDSLHVVTGPSGVTDIPSGTAVNDTHMTWAFFVRDIYETGIGDSRRRIRRAALAWGASQTKAVGDGVDPEALLSFHDSEFNEFTAQLSPAQSPLYGEWALLVGEAGTGSNGSSTPIPVIRPGTGSAGGGCGKSGLN